MLIFWELQNYVGQGKVISPQIDDHTIYYSRNEKGGSNGVAFITRNFISKHVLGYNPVSDRIISIRIQA